MRSIPTVSVVISTKNESDVIVRLLTSISKQTLKDSEIIVVDNNSTDKTQNLSRKFTKNVYTYGPERSAQRNFGAKKAKGEYLLFVDADMELSQNVLKSCLDTMSSRSNIGAIVIPEKSIGRTYWEKVKAFERSFYNESGDTVTDAARFFSRKAFIKAGGYDETITGPEDWDLPEQVKEMGYKIERSNAYIFHHERISSIFSLAYKKYYYGLRAHRYFTKHKLSTVGPKTIYFLRPVFYRQWKKLVKNPLLTAGMIWMMTLETFAGGLGYVIGRYKKI